MYSFLLKKALPFALTFVFGAALSALVALFWSDGTGYEVAQVRQSRLEEYGRGRRECRMRRHDLVAESKPLNILYTPVARYGSVGADGIDFAHVNVTFGADGEVKEVKPLASLYHGRDESLVRVKAMWEAVETAARGIRFTPETINGIPVTVEREVAIRYADE